MRSDRKVGVGGDEIWTVKE
ncbi:uncharacterized protein G2W53_003677 [Senna tora]|uniref:Uncharacterized protein n=1 Tax=Senna tora TaxID=362788 RepID=A0A835CGL4_9FABA|nr:uncharacterized protein G2W53_003677 [Senna tora]